MATNIKSMTKWQKEIKAVYDANLNDLSKLKKKINEFLKRGEEEKNIYVIGACNYFNAYIYYNLGQRTKILSYALKAASIFDNTKDYEMLAKSHNILGIAYLGQENYQLALDSYSIAFQTITKHKNVSLDKYTVLNNMGECYFQMGDYKKSLKIYEKCFATAKRQEPIDIFSLAIYGVNLSDTYESLGKLNEAVMVLDYVEDSIDTCEFKVIIAAFYARRACIAYLMDDIEKGNFYSDKVIELLKDSPDTYELHRDFEKIAHFQIENGEYLRAHKYAKILLDYANSTGHSIDQIIAYRVEADYFNRIENKELALKYYAKLNDLYIKREKDIKSIQLGIQKKIDTAKKDVKDLICKVRKTEEIAERDQLSQLLNRSGLLKVSHDYFDIATEKKKTIGGIFIDIDYFKEYNDTFGHTKGDEIIREISDVCLKEESPTVKFSRYGGDEIFGITLDKKDEDIIRIAKNIAKNIYEKNIQHPNNPINGRITLSIGITNIKIDENDTILDIINFSDKAVYRSKENGRNQIYLYDPHHFDENGQKNHYIKIEQ